MKKYLLNLMLLSLISLPLKAGEMSSSQDWNLHHNLMEKRQNMILECRAAYLEKEITLSQRMRELRKSMNDCMKQNKSDHSDYFKERETLDELRALRERVRNEYMKNMSFIHSL